MLHKLEDLAGHYLIIYHRISCLPFIIQLVQQIQVLTQVQDEHYVANSFLLPNNLARQ
jgi:hypothetical protein